MSRRSTTLKDLSERLRLSVSTVSRALKDHPDISEKTKREVQDLAKRLHYIPNFSAQSLRNRSSKTLGVIIPKLGLNHSYRVINGMLEQSRAMGYRLIISESGHNFDLEKDMLQNMIHSGVDGILLSISNATKSVDHIIEAQQLCPLVLYDKISNKVACTKIIVDDEVGAFNAVNHLIDQGRRKILYINGAKNSLSAKKRLDGYLKALAENGIERNETLIKQCVYVDIDEGRTITQRAIEDTIAFDAIFAVTDNVAIGAIKALKDYAISIPGQVAVIGFSNSKNATIIEPNLSSVDQPGYSIGVHAVKSLVEQIEHDYDYFIADHKTIVLKTGLKIRASSRVT